MVNDVSDRDINYGDLYTNITLIFNDKTDMDPDRKILSKVAGQIIRTVAAAPVPLFGTKINVVFGQN